MRIVVGAVLDAAVLDRIEQGLVEALRRNVPPNDAAPLCATALEGDGTLIGGLVGATSYGWLLVKMLWVSAEARGRGVGALLMAEAEAAALARGCHAAWLDTSSGEAERFYRQLGYESFGLLQNGPGEAPENHRRVFLAKRLSGAAENPPPDAQARR